MTSSLPKAAVLTATILLNPCSYSAGPTVLAESLKQNDLVTGSIKIGRRTIVLPAGNWQLVVKSDKSSSIEGSSQAPTIMTLYFQEIKNRRLSRGLEIAATTFSGRMNWLDDPCKVKGDSYWLDDRKRGANDQFCIRVGYSSGIVDGARGDAFQAWAREIKSNAIGYSPEMPFVSVVRYTAYDYLRMSISFDPFPVGILPSQNPARQFNEWQGQTVSQRQKHARFYDSLVDWAPKFATAVQRDFEQDEYLTSGDFGEPVFIN